MNKQYEACETCGALLGDRQAHDRWHRDMEEQMATALSAVPSYDEWAKKIAGEIAWQIA